MSLNPNINSDLAVGAVITEFLRARALKLNPSYLDATVSDPKKKCMCIVQADPTEYIVPPKGLKIANCTKST